MNLEANYEVTFSICDDNLRSPACGKDNNKATYQNLKFITCEKLQI